MDTQLPQTGTDDPDCRQSPGVEVVPTPVVTPKELAYNTLLLLVIPERVRF